jgi:hypothetical protein
MTSNDPTQLHPTSVAPLDNLQETGVNTIPSTTTMSDSTDIMRTVKDSNNVEGPAMPNNTTTAQITSTSDNFVDGPNSTSALQSSQLMTAKESSTTTTTAADMTSKNNGVGNHSRIPYKYDPEKITLRFLFANRDGLTVTLTCNPSDTVGEVKGALVSVWPKGKFIILI